MRNHVSRPSAAADGMMTPEHFNAWRQKLGLSAELAALSLGITAEDSARYALGFEPVPFTVHLACMALEMMYAA